MRTVALLSCVLSCVVGCGGCGGGAEPAKELARVHHAEVAAMFAELGVRMEQFHVDNAAYPPGPGESVTHPAKPSREPRPFAPMPAAWNALGFKPPMPSVRCAYTWVSGSADNTEVGAIGAGFGFTAPKRTWYYALARCDADGDPVVDSYYFASSLDAQLKTRDPDR